MVCYHQSNSVSKFHLDTLFDRIDSLYYDYKKDRQWYGFCNKHVPYGSLSGYQWHNYQNHFFQGFQFICGYDGKVLTGIFSDYRDGDRIYGFECAQSQFKTAYGCEVNQYTTSGQSWSKSIPSNMYLIGIDSRYDSSIK